MYYSFGRVRVNNLNAIKEQQIGLRSNVLQEARLKPLSLILLPGDNDSNYISESQKSKVTDTTAVTFIALTSFFVWVVMCVPSEVKGSSVSP